jgi:hypothetical protein
VNFDDFLPLPEERFPMAEFPSTGSFFAASGIKATNKKYKYFRFHMVFRKLFSQNPEKNTFCKPNSENVMFPVKQDISICLNSVCIFGLQILFHVKPE